MTLVLKEFKVPMTALVGETVQNAPLESDENMLILQMFYDDRWTHQSRDLVLWFDGGAGDGIENTSYGRPNYVVQNGYVYINCSAFKPSKHPMNFTLNGNTPIHDYIRYVFEVESFISYIYENLINDDIAKKYVTQDSKICLTGTSRGAGNILQWSCLSREIYSKHRDKIIGLVANSPAGGGTTKDWQGPYVAQRATYKFYQNVMHQTIGCMGAGDVTHTNRAHIERIYAAISNPLVKIIAEGNDAWGHTWPGLSSQNQYKTIFNHAFGLLEQS
ncbi:hypothetical protein [Acinetobacter rudis]|uniref:hypothetical protein n=1 Tax=Acinetobacter rudis TaxID=632955 RepID=UPI003341B2B4